MTDDAPLTAGGWTARIVWFSALCQVLALIMALLMVIFPSPPMMLVGIGGGGGLFLVGCVLYIVGFIRALRARGVV